jgi:hypothetical protein
MTQYKEDVYVKCPYYTKESAIAIKCDGVCGDHTINTYANEHDKNEYKEDFCRGFYWNCPLYITLKEDGK